MAQRRAESPDRAVGRIGEHFAPVNQDALLNAHGRPGAEVRAQSLQQGDGRGRDGFSFSGKAAHGNIPQELKHGRSRSGQPAVGAVDAAVGQGQGAAHKTGGREAREQRADKADVQDAVQGPHFMEHHLLGREAVHRAFGIGQQGEGL